MFGPFFNIMHERDNLINHVNLILWQFYYEEIISSSGKTLGYERNLLKVDESDKIYKNDTNKSSSDAFIVTFKQIPTLLQCFIVSGACAIGFLNFR